MIPRPLLILLFLFSSIAGAERVWTEFPSDKSYSFARTCVEKVRHQYPLPKVPPDGDASPPLERRIANSRNAVIILGMLEKAALGTKGQFKIYDVPHLDNVARIRVSEREIELGLPYKYYENALPYKNRRDFMAALVGHEMGHYFEKFCIEPGIIPAHGLTDVIGMYLMELAGFNVNVMCNGKMFDYFYAAYNAVKPITFWDKESHDRRTKFINGYLAGRPHDAAEICAPRR